MHLSRTDRIAIELLNLQLRNGHTRRVAAPDRDFMDSADLEKGWRDDDNSIDNRNIEDDDRNQSLFNKDEDDDDSGLDDDLEDDDDLDLEDDESEDHVDIGTLRKARLKILAGMVWAYLGEPEAVVEEVAPNELSIKVQDLSWKVLLDEDGRIRISGFDSGAEQYVGRMPDKNAENAILKISKNIHQLVSEDIDKRSVPPEPPVHFGPEETEEEEPEEGAESAPPAAPEGDQGAAPGPGAPEASPFDLGTAGEAPPPAVPAAPAAPGVAPPAPGAAPPPPPAPGQQPFPPMAPAASRHNNLDWVTLGRRRAHARLDEVGNQLRDLGDSLGEDGEEVFTKLADRVDRVLGVLEKDNP